MSNNFDWWDYSQNWSGSSSTLTTTTSNILYGRNGAVYLGGSNMAPLATKSEWTLKYGEPPQQQPVTNAKRWATVEGGPIPESPEDWLARRVNEICDWSPM